MVETFEVLVPDFFHVEAVDRADVDALLAADALRVVELRDHDRLALPVVRAVEHVDAASRALPLALAAADADVDLEDRVLADPVDQDDLLVRVLLRHPDFVRLVVQLRPTVPTVRRALGSDVGDFIAALAVLHVHELALARADEAALLRPDPTGSLRLDLRAELQEAIDERLRPYRAAGDEDVRRHERVRALHDRVRVVVRPAADRALAHRDDPFRLRHLFV